MKLIAIIASGLAALAGLAAIVLVAVDLWMGFWRWQARIHIGRWSDRPTWQRAVERRARRWLRRPPVVPRTDARRWLLWDMVRGRYRSRTIQSWQRAGLLMGLDDDGSTAFVSDRLLDPATGDWRQPPAQPDEALLAWALMRREALPPAAWETMLLLLLDLRGERATIPYRAWVPHLRFVDTIGFTVPFLVTCGRGDMARAQIEEYDRALLRCGEPFPAHAWDLERGVPVGIHDWGRGVGWYALGLVGGNIEGGLFAERIVALARRMTKWQRPDGGWGAAIFDRASPGESSATAMVGLLMLRAWEIGGDPEFLNAARAAERFLMSATRRTGELDYCQGDTPGPGNYSRRMDIMPFAQGLALRLSKDLNGYENR